MVEEFKPLSQEPVVNVSTPPVQLYNAEMTVLLLYTALPLPQCLTCRATKQNIELN